MIKRLKVEAAELYMEAKRLRTTSDLIGGWTMYIDQLKVNIDADTILSERGRARLKDLNYAGNELYEVHDQLYKSMESLEKAARFYSMYEQEMKFDTQRKV